MKLKGGFKLILISLLVLSPFCYSKIELFSLREREEGSFINPPITEELPLEKEVEEEELKPTRIIKPSKKIKKALPEPEERVKTQNPETQTEVFKETIEETMPFSIFKKGEIEKEGETPLWVFFSLAITSFCGIILLILIIIHLTKGGRKANKPLFQVPPSDMEEELKNLKESSKMVSSQVKEIEKMIPKEFVEALRSGKIFSQLAKDISLSLEPRIRELGKDISLFLEPKIRELSLTYQAIKKFLIQLEGEIQELSSLKGLNFKDLARQTSTEFIIPIKNEFEKAKLFYENLIASFEKREEGRFSTIEKKYQEVKESVDEVHNRLVGLESLITSFTMFDQESFIRPKKREPSTPQAQTAREELNKLIYELADSGLSVDEIAKKTNIGKGEINLILSFRKKVG